MLGLRSALRYIVDVLKQYQEQGKPDSGPLFIQWIELYLCEPVISDDPFIKALFLLREHLQTVEGLRKVLIKYAVNSAIMETNLPTLKDAARRGIPLAETLCKKVDVAIEKMKPLGGS